MRLARPSSHLTEPRSLAKIRFFPPVAAPSIGEVASWCGAALTSEAVAGRIIGDVAALDQAGPGDLTFLDNAKYLDALRSTRAAAVLVAPRYAAAAPAGCAVLLTAEPYRAMAAVMAKLFPSAVKPGSVSTRPASRPRPVYTPRRGWKPAWSLIPAR